jgi:hypothetical protein
MKDELNKFLDIQNPSQSIPCEPMDDKYFIYFKFFVEGNVSWFLGYEGFVPSYILI